MKYLAALALIFSTQTWNNLFRNTLTINRAQRF